MQHGSKTFEVVAPRSRFFQGGFGRLFPNLPPWKPELVPDTAKALEEHMRNIALEKMTENAVNPGKPTDLAAGYTFFGQFVDHDITLDLTPISDAEVDPNRLHNGRTPRLDLDSVYGLGPEAQPYLYDKGEGGFQGKMLVGKIGNTSLADLPRLSGSSTGQETALIGDHRNDENAVLSQLQLAFIQAHNALVDVQDSALSGAEKFEQARKSLRWLYQWIVVNDFLPRICRADIAEHALFKESRGPNKDPKAAAALANVDMTYAVSPDRGFVWKLGYRDIYNWRDTPFMPVEFSVAAYRFGHTLVRHEYDMNSKSTLPIFSKDGINLRGFRALEASNVIDWTYFLPIDNAIEPQKSRAFDPFLAPALTELPEDPDNPGDRDHFLNVLAARNLVRGVRLELPAGTAVAKALGITQGVLMPGDPDALWFYILREAETKENGDRLGAVGSIIVASTLAGLLLGDPLSYLNIEPCWSPDQDPCLKLCSGIADTDGKWRLSSIIRLSQSGGAAGAAAHP